MVSIELCKICKNSVHSRLEIAKKAPFFAKNIKKCVLISLYNPNYSSYRLQIAYKNNSTLFPRLDIVRRKAPFHGKKKINF